MTKISLVTGGCGGLGTELVTQLAARGRRVRVLDIRQPHSPVEGVDYFTADIRAAEDTDRACDGANEIFHLAAVHPGENPDLIRDVNIEGTSNMVETAALAGASAFVFASSCDVYGLPPEVSPCPESAPLYSSEPFSLSKVMGEELCFELTERTGCKVSVIRTPMIVGPRMEDESMLRWIVGRAMNHQPVFLPGGGHCSRSYADVSDVARAMILAAENDNAGGHCFNIAYDRPYTLEQFARTVIRSARSFSVTVPVPETIMEIALRIMQLLGSDPHEIGFLETTDYDCVYDISKAREMLGWTPDRTLSATMYEYMRWYKRRMLREDAQ